LNAKIVTLLFFTFLSTTDFKRKENKRHKVNFIHLFLYFSSIDWQ